MRSSSIPLPRVLLALCAALAVIGFEADIPRKIEQYHAERQWEARLQYAIKSTQYPYVYGVATLLDGDKLPEWFSVNINTFDGQEHARTTATVAEQSGCIEFASGSTVYWHDDGSAHIRTDITETHGLFACHERVPKFDEILFKRWR